jgi:hypothetical protein
VIWVTCVVFDTTDIFAAWRPSLVCLACIKGSCLKRYNKIRKMLVISYYIGSCIIWSLIIQFIWSSWQSPRSLKVMNKHCYPINLTATMSKYNTIFISFLANSKSSRKIVFHLFLSQWDGVDWSNKVLSKFEGRSFE